jgi:hypothetical protein
MSDFNEISKYIKKNRELADAALRHTRYHTPVPDTVRDVFDDVTPFTMAFTTTHSFKTVKMDLEFFGPPPSLGCCADCYCTVCENHTGASPLIDLRRDYVPTSVSVHINNIQTTEFTETDPSTGKVTITATITDSDSINVCYIYKYTDCTSPTP